MLKRKLIKLFVIAVVTLTVNSLIPISAFATTQKGEVKGYHSIDEVINQWEKLKPTYQGKVFVVQPSAIQPYKTGKVDEGYINDALNYFNFVRYLSYLAPVELDLNLTKQAQYGAVLTTANGELEHNNPIHPENMPDDFYKIGKVSTSSSNLSGGGLIDSILLCLNENRNVEGCDDVGHREWILDPAVTKVGFGTTMDYSVQNLPFGKMAKDTKRPDYLEWPSKGAFPNQFINRSAMWSINLDSNKYRVDNIDDVLIKITRLSDNKEWNLHKIDSFSNFISGFKLSTNENHGKGSSTIVFHIADNGLSDINYLGEYKVEVVGLKNISDNNEKVEYIINFFDLNDYVNKND